MKKRIAVALFTLLALPSLAFCADLAGYYKCVGQNPNGSKYEGFVKITPKGEGYSVKWTIGRSVYTGFGITGDGVFAVSLLNSPGVVEYKVKHNGVLDGTWAMASEHPTISPETLIPEPSGMSK